MLGNRHDEGIRLLQPLLDELPSVEGSNAQREVVEDTLFGAPIEAGRSEDARELLEGRLGRRAHALDRRLLDERAMADRTQWDSIEAGVVLPECAAALVAGRAGSLAEVRRAEGHFVSMRPVGLLEQPRELACLRAGKGDRDGIGS
jgi:hypothetical protein